MTEIKVDPQVLMGLKGKVVVITGAANGIGKTAAKLFYDYGACVAIGDLDEEAGNGLAEEFGSRGHFVRTDISSWASQRDLFRSTFDKFGSVDCVVANAAMPEKSDFLWEDKFDENGDLVEPDLTLIDVNVKGTLYTSKLALHYFEKSSKPDGALVVTGSAAGYFGGVPITKYATSKHALLGLVRSLAILAPRRGFRVNYIAPWLTATDFSSELDEIWGDRPINSQKEVSEAILMACADPRLNGRGLFVAKRIVDTEVALHQLESQWLGPEVSELWEMGRAHLQQRFGSDPTHYLELSDATK
ncbi:hypothetical protein N7454_005294 [Penicillium verhagenii]|nr:hypothetical protein N7454_005294 [Penicillium verhagenii]